MNSYWLPLRSVEPIQFYAQNPDGSPVSGMLNLMLSIRRQSDNWWLDWDDLTFKAIGWTQLQITMNEINPAMEPGVYVHTFSTTPYATPDTYFPTIQQVPPTVFPLTVIAELKIGGIPDDCRLTRKWAQNRLDMAAGVAGNWVLYDDDSITPLLTYDVSDVAGGPIAPPPGAPARRTRGI